MARVCDICGKGPVTGNTISHANNKTNRRWYPNLQRVRAVVDGRTRRLRVCTQCLKSNRVIKAAHPSSARLHPVSQVEPGDQSRLKKKGDPSGSPLLFRAPPSPHSLSSSMRATSAPSPTRCPSLMIRV